MDLEMHMNPNMEMQFHYFGQRSDTLTPDMQERLSALNPFIEMLNQVEGFNEWTNSLTQTVAKNIKNGRTTAAFVGGEGGIGKTSTTLYLLNEATRAVQHEMGVPLSVGIINMESGITAAWKRGIEKNTRLVYPPDVWDYIRALMADASLHARQQKENGSDPSAPWFYVIEGPVTGMLSRGTNISHALTLGSNSRVQANAGKVRDAISEQDLSKVEHSLTETGIDICAPEWSTHLNYFPREATSATLSRQQAKVNRSILDSLNSAEWGSPLYLVKQRYPGLVSLDDPTVRAIRAEILRIYYETVLDAGSVSFHIEPELVNGKMPIFPDIIGALMMDVDKYAGTDILPPDEF